MKDLSTLWRSSALAAVAVIAMAGFVVPATAASTSNAINTSSRWAVSNAYTSRFLPTTTGAIAWTGNVTRCEAGTQSSESITKTAEAINFYRGLGGLDSITMTTEQNLQAQDAALIMEANQNLNHTPPSTSKCYSERGAEGAGNSNLHGGTGGYVIENAAQSIKAYMNDAGSSNIGVGHRRWIMNPYAASMGVGTTKSFNAVHVFGPIDTTNVTPEWVAFPNAGYFPQQLEPRGRWSLSAKGNTDIDFSQAQVTVKDSNGVNLSLTKHIEEEGYGSDSLAFDVAGLKYATGEGESAYTVTVSGMKNVVTKTAIAPYTYTVKLFDGTQPGPEPEPTPDPTPTTPTPDPEPTETAPAPEPTATVPAPQPTDPVTPSPAPQPTETTPAEPTPTAPAPTASPSPTPTAPAPSPTVVAPSPTAPSQPAPAPSQPAPAPSQPAPAPVPVPVSKPAIKSQAEIVSIDGAGVLWNYHDGKTPRTKIGSGWGVFRDIHVADWNSNGVMDIVAKHNSGALYVYYGNASGGFSPRLLGNGWTPYDIRVVKWNKSAKFPSIIAKNKVDGFLWEYRNPSGSSVGTRVKLGGGWKSFNVNVLDWDRNGNMDIVARNPQGQLKLYRTNGYGALLNESRATIGSGWGPFTSITTVRKFRGAATDGLIARNGAGALIYYQANTGKWSSAAIIGKSGWNPFKIASN